MQAGACIRLDVLTTGFVSAACEAARLGPASVVIAGVGGDDAALRLALSTTSPPGPAGPHPLAAASMIKTPIALGLLDATARGTLRLDERLRISAEAITENDAASPLEAGYETTLEALARLMIVRSDNVATNALIDRLGRTRITERLHALGLRETFVRRKLSGGDVPVHDPGAAGRNAHPPEDAARLFSAIATDGVPGAAWLRDSLAAQEWNDKLSAGLRPGDGFAHKTGDTSAASHDGGILTLPDGRRFVIVVYTALPASPEADARLGDFMRRIRPSLDRSG